MNTLEKFSQVLIVQNKNKYLGFETWKGYTWNVCMGIQAVLILYIVTTESKCIPWHKDPTKLIVNATWDQQSLGGYIGLTCSTEIKWDVYGIYIEKLIFFGFAATIMLINSKFTFIFNRYDCIINRQNIPQYIDHIPVRSDKDYRAAYKNALVKYTVFQVISFLILLAFYITVVVVTIVIDKYRRLFFPVGKSCDYELTWNQDHYQRFECHFVNEYTIFLLWIGSMVIIFFLLLIYIFSISFVIHARYKFDTIYPLDAKYIPQMSEMVEVNSKFREIPADQEHFEI